MNSRRIVLTDSTKIAADGWDLRLYSASSKVGIVLMHEILGFDDYADSVGAELARAGFWVVAPDLYRGKHVESLEEAFKVRQSLKDADVLAALGAGLRLLCERIGATAMIGSMGFCMGGGYALLGACNLNMQFCVDYYGMVERVEQVKDVIGPVLLFLASEDERVTPWAYQHFLPAATRFKKRVDVHLYPNARHAFHRPNWEGHNAEAAKDAWAKTLVFLSQFK